jgi:hypothetical protein
MLLEIPEARIAWTDRRLRPALLVILLAAMIAAVLLPSTMINADEYLYAGQARILLDGRLTPIDGDPLPGNRDPADPEAARYPPGWPALLALPAAAGFRAMFLASLAAHLLGGLAVARMLVRRDVSSSLVAVYLFHPVFWSFSRTLMSDVPNGALLLLAMDAWEQNRAGAVGGTVGYALLMRMANVTSVVGLGLATLDKWRARRGLCAALFIGIGVGAALAGGANILKYGQVTGSPYASGGFANLNGRLFWQHLALYGFGLLVIPPCPLACIILRRRSVDRWCIMAVPVLVFFLFYSYHDRSSRLLETLLAGQRLIIPAHVAAMMSTARIWGQLPIPRLSTLAPAGGLVAAIIQYKAVHHLERRYRPAAELIAACNPSAVAFNRNASRVALAVNAKRYNVIDGRDPVGLGDVVVVATSSPTNQPIDRPPTYDFPPSLLERWSTCQKAGEFFIFDLASRCPHQYPPCEAVSKPLIGTLNDAGP